MSFSTLALTLFIFGALTMQAQDTCMTVTIPNPHGAAMQIMRVWVTDSVNFSVEPMRTLPFDIGDTESWDARLCILARDGGTYTTTIRYQTTHGPAGFPVTMQAPLVSAVMDHTRAQRGVLRLYPSPSSGVVTIDIPDRDLGTVVIDVIDPIGRLAVSFESAATNGTVTHDLSTLPNGSYLVVARYDDEEIGRQHLLLVD